MTIRSSILIALSASFVAAAPAAAQIVVEGNLPTATVSFADLDLSDSAGIDTLNGRVRRAAETLCVDNGVRGIGDKMTERSCLSFALGHARGQVDRAIAQYGSPQYAGRSTIVVAGR